ncbi:MAG: SCO1664 family protein [Actinomycetes bacterium]
MADPSGESNHAPFQVAASEVAESEVDEFEKSFGDTAFEDADAEFEDDEYDEDSEEQSIEFQYSATITPGATEMAELLERGSIEILGLMPWSSNGTYLVQVTRGSDYAPAIYKPERGERPLWDFPGALWKREVATYELSHWLGFGSVPTTVTRHAAPMGRGSLQAFVPAVFSEHYFTLRDRAELSDQLKTLCVLDLVANSADRKGGHCLIDSDNQIWAIDNGLSFHEEPKLRTVIWDFAGDPLPSSAAHALISLLETGLCPQLQVLLTPTEQEATLRRAQRVLAQGHFPHDMTGRSYPWPLV